MTCTVTGHLDKRPGRTRGCEFRHHPIGVIRFTANTQERASRHSTGGGRLTSTHDRSPTTGCGMANRTLRVATVSEAVCDPDDDQRQGRTPESR